MARVVRGSYWVIGGALLVLVGCSSSSSGGSGGSSDAVQKCNTYVDTFCAKTEECTTQKGTAVSKADCKSQASNIIDCSKSKSVKPSYPTCITDLESLPCSQTDANGAITALPASCNGAILQSTDPSAGSGVE